MQRPWGRDNLGCSKNNKKTMEPGVRLEFEVRVVAGAMKASVKNLDFLLVK